MKGLGAAPHECRELEPLPTGEALLPGLLVSTLTMNADPQGH